MFLHPNEILLHSMSHPTHLFLTWVTSLLPFNWNSPNPVVRRQSSRSYLSRHPDWRGRSSRCQECNLIAAVIKAPLGMSDSKVFRNKRLSRCKLKREILILTIGHTCYRSLCTSFTKLLKMLKVVKMVKQTVAQDVFWDPAQRWTTRRAMLGGQVHTREF